MSSPIFTKNGSSSMSNVSSFYANTLAIVRCFDKIVLNI